MHNVNLIQQLYQRRNINQLKYLAQLISLALQAKADTSKSSAKIAPIATQATEDDDGALFRRQRRFLPDLLAFHGAVHFREIL
mmetsp:Transcript_31272/g.50391  ORF Transcript_31272/g.50391 Transcript_31272/m.50391 type:complete len:83 (-) Transcript_31272:1491-1739(-)